MATASPEDGDTAWTTSSAVYLPNPAFLRTTQANHQSNGLPPHDSWTERHRRLPSPTRDTTQYEPSPSAAASVSPALVSELARSGFGMFGLLHSWKITSLEALGALGDRHFKEFSDAAQAAEIAPDAISELRALRRRLALQAMAAVDAAFTSEGGDAEERNLLTICAQVCRKLAAVTLDRDNAAKERLSAARLSCMSSPRAIWKIQLLALRPLLVRTIRFAQLCQGALKRRNSFCATLLFQL